MEIYFINHPIFGPYLQQVYPTMKEAGHEELASDTLFGWGMPTDPPAAEFVRNTVGKVVFEIGSGLGDTVALPAVSRGAHLVFATNIEREAPYLDDMAQEAAAMGRRDALKTQSLDENWWTQEHGTGWWTQAMQNSSLVASILGADDASSLPADGTVDLMIARHSAQFGTPTTFLHLLDLAAAALKPGGTFTGVNFTLYTGYLYGKDNGTTLARLFAQNEAFAAGEATTPGGAIEGLGALMGEAVSGEHKPFLFFDQPTIIGLLRHWMAYRAERHLPTNLELTASYYFSPPAIWANNKLREPAPKSLMEKENHVFVLTRVVAGAA